MAESSDGVLDARLTERIVALLVNNGVTAPEEAFPFVDVDGDGLLSVADLSQACADVTIAASELQIAEWIRESAAAAGQEDHAYVTLDTWCAALREDMALAAVSRAGSRASFASSNSSRPPTPEFDSNVLGAMADSEPSSDIPPSPAAEPSRGSLTESSERPPTPPVQTADNLKAVPEKSFSATSMGFASSCSDEGPEDGSVVPVMVANQVAAAGDQHELIGSTLSVHIIRADHLPQMDVTGNADPYVKMVVGEHQRVTGTLKNTLRPHWDERFVVDVESSCRQIVLTLMDWDRFSANEVIGECRVEIADVADMVGSPFSLQVLKPGTGEAVVGKDNCKTTLELEMELGQPQSAKEAEQKRLAAEEAKREEERENARVAKEAEEKRLAEEKAAAEEAEQKRLAAEEDKREEEWMISVEFAKQQRALGSRRLRRAPAVLSEEHFDKLTASPYCERPDSVSRTPRDKRLLTPRTLPYEPRFFDFNPLVQSKVVTPRGLDCSLQKCLDSETNLPMTTATGRSSCGFSESTSTNGARIRSATARLREDRIRPATAPSNVLKSPASSMRSPTRSTGRQMHHRCREAKRPSSGNYNVKPLWRSCGRSSSSSALPPTSTKSVSLTPGGEEHMLENPYEIVPLAMADKSTNHISPARWPFRSQWISGEARYRGFCTPVLPENSTVPARCSLEAIEQMYAEYLAGAEKPQVSVGAESTDANSLLIEIDGKRLVQDQLQIVDDIDEKVWASEKMGRSLLDHMAEQQFEVAQVHAVEELAFENQYLWKALVDIDGRKLGDRMLCWAERKTRQDAEAHRKIVFNSAELLEDRCKRIIAAWTTIVFKKVNFLAVMTKQAASKVKEMRVKAATKLQALGRGHLGRRAVLDRQMEGLAKRRKCCTKLQALYRGWKDRLRVKVIRSMKNTNTAVQRLFQAQKAFQDFDCDGDGLINRDEFTATLHKLDVFVDSHVVDVIFDSLPSARLKTSQGQSAPSLPSNASPNKPVQKKLLTFSDYCLLIKLNVPRDSIEKMQEAINIFARFDEDGSGAIDADELKAALQEMEVFTGVPVDENIVREAVQQAGGDLNFEQFVKIFGIDAGSQDAAIEDELEKAFKVFENIDLDGHGKTGIKQICEGLRLMGVTEPSVEEMKGMFQDSAQRDPEMIDFLGFCHMCGIKDIPVQLKRKYCSGYDINDDMDETLTYPVLCSREVVQPENFGSNKMSSAHMQHGMWTIEEPTGGPLQTLQMPSASGDVCTNTSTVVGARASLKGESKAQQWARQRAKTKMQEYDTSDSSRLHWQPPLARSRNTSNTDRSNSALIMSTKTQKPKNEMPAHSTAKPLSSNRVAIDETGCRPVSASLVRARSRAPAQSIASPPAVSARKLVSRVNAGGVRVQQPSLPLQMNRSEDPSTTSAVASRLFSADFTRAAPDMNDEETKYNWAKRMQAREQVLRQRRNHAPKPTQQVSEIEFSGHAAQIPSTLVVGHPGVVIVGQSDAGPSRALSGETCAEDHAVLLSSPRVLPRQQQVPLPKKLFGRVPVWKRQLDVSFRTKFAEVVRWQRI